MKIIQTDTELQIKNGILGQIVSGIILTIIGIAIAVAMAAGAIKAQNGQSGPVWLIVASAAFVIIGGLIIVFAHSRTVTLRKGGTSNIQVKGIFGGKTKEQSFETNHIVAVRLMTQESMRTKSNNSNNSMSASSQVPERQSELMLVLNDNSLIELATVSSSIGGSGIGEMSLLITKAPLSDESNKIASFLGVPLQVSDNTLNPISIIKDVVDGFRHQPEESQTMTSQVINPVDSAIAPSQSNPIQPVPDTTTTTSLEPVQPSEGEVQSRL